MDSRRWISFLLDILLLLDNVDFSALPDVQKRMLQMLYVTIWGKTAPDWNDDEVQDNLYALSDSTVLLGELMDLLRYRFEQIDFLDAPVDLGFDCPLDLHCTYSRDQLLAALDFMKPNTVREGVKWLPDKQLDVFMVTLNKVEEIRRRITPVAVRYRLKAVYLFGSHTRGEATDESDIDLLIDTETIPPIGGRA